MSDNKKFRIQNGVDVTGELSINDVVVIDANGKVVPEAISEAISGSTSSDIAALQAQVSAILGTSPETLDTLQEIVASFQDADSNIVTTVSTNTTAIADMQPQVSTNTAAIAAANARTSGISTSSGSSNIQMSAEVDMDGNKVTNMGEPTDGSDAATKDYVDVKSQLAVTTGATDKTELLAAIAAETNRATVVESTLQTNIDSLSDDKDSDIAQEITNRTTADALLQAQIDAEESARTIQDASLDSKITSEATRAVAAELGLQQSINNITSGTSEFTGDLIPDQDNVHSLGSETKMWKDVYIGPGSLYINGQKVIEDNSGTITVNADPGQNLSLNTSGGGAIDLNSGDESVQIRSDLVISSSKTISTTGGAPTKFGGDVDMQGNTLGNVAEPVNDNDAVTKAWFESYVATPHTGSKTFVDDVVIQGNLTVSGSTITVNSETMSVADNMVDLNSNMTSGTPTENAGIRVMRGDQSPKTFLWNEANDQWTAEGPLKADSFVGDGSGLSGMYGDADVTALVDSDYIQSRQSSSNSLSMGDGEIATFGDSNDLQIYHDGIHSYVQDTNAGNLYLKSNGAEITLRDGSNTSMIRAFTGGGVRLFNNGTERLEVTSTGIDVTGSVEADGGNFTGQVQFNGTAGIQLDDGAQAHTWTLDDNFTSRLNIGTASSSATWKIGSNNNAYLTVSPSGIDVTGTATMDGLTVGDTSVSQSLFQMLANPTNGANTIHFGDGASADAYVGYINYAHDSNSMQFAANGTERMRIDASGNVGIGESSPSVPLHIKGSGTYIAGVESTSAYAYLGLRDSNSGGSMSDPTVGVGAQTNDLAFRAGGAERMRIDAIGRVGIGTSSPDSNITSGIDFNSFVVGRYNLGSGLPSSLGGVFSADSNAGSFNSGDLVLQSRAGVSNRSIIFYTGNITTERMRIDANGNVLVGTTTINGVGGSSTPEGVVLDGNNAQITVGTSSDVCATFNRQTTDGAVVQFRKDGTTVGSINAGAGSVLAIGQGSNYIQFHNSLNSFYASDGNGGRDNAMDIGASGVRFKDLYLSGTANTGSRIVFPEKSTGVESNNSIRAHTNNYLYMFGGSTGLSLANNAGEDTRIKLNDSNTIEFITASTERMRIDASGNVLVSTSSDFASGTVDGIIAQGTNKPAAAFSNTADGQLVKFYQSGNLVGSISTVSNRIAIGKGDVGLFLDNQNDRVTPIHQDGLVDRDASIDLGYASSRFKDLYLSGHANFTTAYAATGIYLGAYASPNLLDDYEEGTWTPVITGTTGTPTVTYYTQDGIYTKIGRTVYYRVGLRVKTISGGSGILRVTGLPFTAKSYAAYTNPFGMANNGGLTASQSGPIVLFVEGNASSLQGRYTNTNADNPLHLSLIQAGSYMLVEGFYEVA